MSESGITSRSDGTRKKRPNTKSEFTRRGLLLSALPIAGVVSGQDGWHLLFDGSTTQGWLEVTGQPFPSECWTVEDGCLKAFPGPKGNQDIRTVAAYSSFEFQFAWRILKGGNSGVKYLVQNFDRWTNAQGLQARARGPEYQLVWRFNKT